MKKASANIDTEKKVISIRGLNKSFDELDILKGVNLDLYQGENLVVLGRSGTGKSVLIKIISGLLKADTGQINVLGNDINKLSPKEMDKLRLKLGFSFQNSALYDSMTVKENLEFPLERHAKDLSSKDRNRIIELVLDAVGLSQSINQMPSELSGGQRKRIGIARTLILKPAIMLYDEPTAGLDPITCIEINKLINDVQRRFNTSSIIITHDLTCARATGDRIVMLLDGQFKRQGTFEEVFDSEDERVRAFTTTTLQTNMSAAENKRSVIVGIFVLLGIAIFVIGVFTLANHQKRLMQSIQLRAVFDDVAGMRKGNNVWFSGVKIGNVKEIRFYGDSQVEVIMDVQADVQQYIREDSKARISSESLIGNKIIEIFGGSLAASPVEDGDLLTAVNPMNTDDMMATLQENNKNLVTITDNLKVLSTNLVEGEGTAGALLTDTAMADNLKKIVANLQRTSANTVQASRALTQFTRKLNGNDGLVHQLLTDTSVFNSLQATVNQLQNASSSATQIANNLQQASQKLTNSNNAVGVLLNDPEFARNLKSTMQNLETGTEKFDQNMEALQSNFLLRGFFRRQEKEKRKNPDVVIPADTVKVVTD